MATPGEHLASSFTQRLNRLIERRLAAGIPATNRAISTWMTEHGYPCSEPTVSLLRSGRQHPSLRTIEGLARFFDVDPGVLVGSDDMAVLARQVLGEERGGIELRSTGLTPSSLLAIQALMDQLRENEGLPPVDDDA